MGFLSCRQEHSSCEGCRAAMSYALKAMSALGECRRFSFILRTTHYIFRLSSLGMLCRPEAFNQRVGRTAYSPVTFYLLATPVTLCKGWQSGSNMKSSGRAGSSSKTLIQAQIQGFLWQREYTLYSLCLWVVWQPGVYITSASPPSLCALAPILSHATSQTIVRSASI